MEKHVLSIEQMIELIDMNIDVTNASMMWVSTGKADYSQELTQIKYYTVSIFTDTAKELYINKETYRNNDIIPTFILQDMLNLLPDIPNYLAWDLHKCGKGYPEKYMCVYEPIDLENTTSKDWIKFMSDNMLDCVFQMIKYCKEKNYL